MWAGVFVGLAAVFQLAIKGLSEWAFLSIRAEPTLVQKPIFGNIRRCNNFILQFGILDTEGSPAQNRESSHKQNLIALASFLQNLYPCYAFVQVLVADQDVFLNSLRRSHQMRSQKILPSGRVRHQKNSRQNRSLVPGVRASQLKNDWQPDSLGYTNRLF